MITIHKRTNAATNQITDVMKQLFQNNVSSTISSAFSALGLSGNNFVFLFFSESYLDFDSKRSNHITRVYKDSLH